MLQRGSGANECLTFWLEYHRTADLRREEKDESMAAMIVEHRNKSWRLFVDASIDV